MVKKKRMVKVNLDKQRNLYFSLNSLELIEELTGKTIDKLADGMSISMLKAVVYAGLVHEDKELTPEIVGEMIGFDDIKELSDAIGEAFGGLK